MENDGEMWDASMRSWVSEHVVLGAKSHDENYS